MHSIVFDRPWYRPVVFGVIAVLLNFLLYWAFATFGLATEYRNTRFVVDGVAIGAFTAYIGRAHRRRIKRRIQQLGYLNHNVRNALQTMMGFEYLSPETRNQAIRESVERIVAAVKEINDNERASLGDLQDLVPEKAKGAKA